MSVHPRAAYEAARQPVRDPEAAPASHATGPGRKSAQTTTGRGTIIAAASALLVLGTPVGGRAHPTLLRTTPAAGAILSAPPATISCWFSERLEPAFHTVRVTDAGGRVIPTGPPRVEASDPTQLTVATDPLPAGVYDVHWRVLSRDGHVAEGSFSFSIHP